MAIYHCSVKVIGRSQGRSAVASASYRSGEKLHSNETDMTFDYTCKGGVAHSEIVLCENAPAEYADRETLWNAVQEVENKKDSQLAREIEFALPKELSLDEQISICRNVAHALAKQGMIVDFSIHHPDKGEANPHCHMMLTMRGIEKDGSWSCKSKKVYELDELGNRIPVIDSKTGQQKIGAKGRKMWRRVTVEDNTWNDQKHVDEWRELVQDKINEGLAVAGRMERVDCRSLKDQGIDREPTIHEGHMARKIEKQGGVADRCQINREIASANAQRAEIRAMIKKLKKDRQELLNQPEEAKKVVKQEPKKALFHINTPEERAKLLAEKKEKDYNRAVDFETEKQWRKNKEYYILNEISYFQLRMDVEEELAPKYGMKPEPQKPVNHYEPVKPKQEEERVILYERMRQAEETLQRHEEPKTQQTRGVSLSDFAQDKKIQGKSQTPVQSLDKGKFIRKSKNMPIYYKDGQYHLYKGDKCKKSGTLDACIREANRMNRD